MNPSLWRPRRQDVWANLWSRPRCLEMWALTICRAGGGLWGIPGMPMSGSVQVEFDLGWFLGKCYGMVQAFFFKTIKNYSLNTNNTTHHCDICWSSPMLFFPGSSTAQAGGSRRGRLAGLPLCWSAGGWRATAAAASAGAGGFAEEWNHGEGAQ